MKSASTLSRLTLFALLAVVVLLGAVMAPGRALAATTLTVTPLTWNVIGLDSNSPTTGPRHFPVGARVCSSVATTNVAVNFVWDSANDNIRLSAGTQNPVTIAALPAGACTDVYFGVEVHPVAAAYDTARRYHITATDASGAASTPTPRELYVEHLISQNRNYITSLTVDGVPVGAGGSLSLMIGGTYTFQLTGGTATQGYNQLEAFINFPNSCFEVQSVSTTYSADNSPFVLGPNKQPYADACLWENDPESPNYRSCTGGDYKAGGAVVATYQVKVLASCTASTVPINSLLYDFSGSSYHYNADYMTARIANVISPATATIAKSFSPAETTVGGVSALTITLGNPNAGTVSGYNFTDPLPSGMVVASPPAPTTTGLRLAGVRTHGRRDLALVREWDAGREQHLRHHRERHDHRGRGRDLHQHHG